MSPPRPWYPLRSPLQISPMAPFRFGDLPPEVRIMIYKIYIDDNDVCFSRDSDTLASLWKQPFLPACFLRVSRMIYQEAAPILYGQTLFKFHGVFALPDFRYFLSCLSESSTDSIRQVEFSSSINNTSYFGIGPVVLETLPNLKTLRFRVEQDIMTRDLQALSGMEKRQKGEKVVLDARPISYYYYCNEHSRPVRISSEVIAKIGEWGWNVVGDYEIIDINHELSDEKKWLSKLKNEQTRNTRYWAVRSSLRSLMREWSITRERSLH